MLLVAFINTTNFAQHNLSVTGGWTFSTLYKIGTTEAFEDHYYYSDLYDFALIHFPSLNLKYNYRHQTFRFSIGISFLSMGTRDYFWKGTRWAYLYLTIPVLAGHQFKLSENCALVIEGGIEAGASVMIVGDLVNLSKFEKTLPYIGLVFGLESNYKRFILGTSFHLGLNNFDNSSGTTRQETIYFRHIGGTVYIGYTFWDSAKAKEKRQKRLTKK